MQKGQISVDLLFTIVAALIIIISFNSLITSTYLSQDKIGLKQQLDMENTKITNLITQTQMIDNSTFRISANLKKMSYLDSNNNQVKEYPLADIKDNTLILSINLGNEIIESKKTFSKSAKTLIILGTDEQKGTLVITNAQ